MVRLGTQEVRRCPCSDPICKSWVVWPLFGSPDSSMRDKQTVEEIVRRINAGESSANGDVK